MCLALQSIAKENEITTYKMGENICQYVSNESLIGRMQRAFFQVKKKEQSNVKMGTEF